MSAHYDLYRASMHAIVQETLVYTKTVDSVFFFLALIGYSISEYPALFTDSAPFPPSERRQTRVSGEQSAFPVCCRKKQKKCHN